MDVFDAIRTLLAVRGYQNKPIPEEVVRRIVESGRLTGSGMNRQPWHFVVVRERETLRRLGALASSGSYVAQAPLAVVVATDKTRFAVSDASRAIQSMVLTAWADSRRSRTCSTSRPASRCWRSFRSAIPRARSDEARSSARRCARWPTSSDLDVRSSEGPARRRAQSTPKSYTLPPTEPPPRVETNPYSPGASGALGRIR